MRRCPKARPRWGSRDPSDIGCSLHRGPTTERLLRPLVTAPGEPEIGHCGPSHRRYVPRWPGMRSPPVMERCVPRSLAVDGRLRNHPRGVRRGEAPERARLTQNERGRPQSVQARIPGRDEGRVTSSLSRKAREHPFASVDVPFCAFLDIGLCATRLESVCRSTDNPPARAPTQRSVRHGHRRLGPE